MAANPKRPGMPWRVALCVALMLVSGAARADVAESASSGFAALLAELKRGHAIDYQKLRYLYAKTAAFDPYGGYAEKGRMMSAYKDKDCSKAAPAATAVLAANYTDIDAHIVMAECAKAHSDAATYGRHRAIAIGLLDSIARSGNGLKPESAYVVISVAEEYVFLGTRGYRVKKQSLVRVEPHEYDAMDVVDKAGTSTRVYFNVDIPTNWLKPKLSKSPLASPPK